MSFSPKDGMTNLDRLSTIRGYWIGTWGNEVQIINSSGAFVGPGAGVSSLNGLSGAVTISAGSNITLTPVGNDIEISATGGSGSGDVTGPGSSTDNALARFNLTTGKIIQNSNAILEDSGAVTFGSAAAPITHTFNGNTLELVTNTAGVSRLRSSNSNTATSAHSSFQALSGANSGYAYNLYSPNNAATNWFSGTLGTNTQYEIRYGGSSGVPSSATAILTVDSSGNINLLSQGSLRLQDTTGGEYVGLRASGTQTTYTITLPSSAPSSNTYLKYDGANYVWDTAGSGSGDVVGPSSSIDNAVARFDSTTGKLIQNSVVTISDLGAYASTSTIAVTGSVSGASLIPTGSSIPTNGMYLPSANALGFATNSLDHGGVSSTGAWTLGSSASTVTHTVNGTLRANRHVGILGAAATNEIATILGTTLASGTSTWGFSSRFTATTTQTAGTHAYYAQPVIPNSSYTVSLVSDYQADGVSKGAAATITRFASFYQSQQTSSATNNACLSDNASFIGNYFINSTNTNPSAFSGAMDWAQISTPSNPAAGRNRLYFKSDGNLYKLNDAGTETAFAAGGSGDVIGPGSATDNALARFDGTTGKLVQNSTVTISDLGAYSSTSTISVSGAMTGASHIVTGSSVPTNGIYLPSANTLGFSANTTAAGSISSAQVWTIGKSGETGTQTIHGGIDLIGTRSDFYTFYLSGTTGNPNTVHYSILNLPTINTNQTGSVYGTFTRVSTPNSSFSTSLVANYVADGMLKGASHTVTNMVNYLCTGPSQWTGTNNAMFGDSINFTGDWFIIQENSSFASKFNGAMDWAQISTPSNPASSRNRLYFKSDDKLYRLNSSGTEVEVGGGSTPVRGINATLDGAGSTITTGLKMTIEVPYSGTITGWTLLADQTGSIEIDVGKSTYSGYPTSSSIAGSELPTISSSTKGQDLSLSTWTTSVTAGDILYFTVNSCTSITRAALTIRIQP